MTADADALERACAIGDRFVAWQGASGRPDARLCPYVTDAYGFSPVNGHCPPSMAQALYMLYDRTGNEIYKQSADRYAIFSFSYPRDPVPPVDDRQRRKRLTRIMESEGSTEAGWAANQRDPRISNHPQSRAWQYGAALYPALFAFRQHNPDEDCFDARMEALFDWLQFHRTELGHAYNIGYPPAHCLDPAITDAAYTDDLRMVGAGLVGYAMMTGRTEGLERALLLADYYLRPHSEGLAEGAFLEEIGTWCIGPWPIPINIEHFTEFRVDRAGWGWTARGAVEFLTMLHSQLPAQHGRAALMRDRCIRSVRWQFSCQFADGAVGMQTQDDAWLGMTAGALLAWRDIQRAGWVDAALQSELGGKVALAKAWLVANTTTEMIDAGGYRRVTGQTSPWPPENLVWLLAWTVEALLSLHEID